MGVAGPAVELSPLGQPARAEVIFARNLERKVYPVALTLK
jgi:hypothetical protein